MCQKGGKLSKDYLRLDRTKRLIEALESQDEPQGGIYPLATQAQHYLQLERTKAFIEALGTEAGITASNLVHVLHGKRRGGEVLKNKK